MDAVRHGWVLDLRPAGAVDLAAAASPAELLTDAVARVGSAAAAWALEVSDAVIGSVLGELPVLGGSPAAVELLRRGNEATTLQALCVLVDPDAPPLDGREANIDGIRSFVHRSVPLEVVLRGVRRGHAETSEAFSRACVEMLGQEGAAGELTALTRDLFAYVDELSDAMVRTYLSELEVWSVSAAATRAQTVRDLLEGGDTTTPEAASRTLGYDLHRRHLAALIWVDLSDDSTTLPTAAAEVMRAAGALAVLTVPVSSDRVWAWGVVGAPAHTHSRHEAISAVLARRGVQVVFGGAHDGVAGFRRSHREALRGEEVEQLRRGAGRPARSATTYDDVAVLALLGADLEAARRFVVRELGGLAARSEAMATLRSTLYHYLDAERSLVDVAGRLHIARGTVTYRVRRAQEVLGRGLDRRRFELHAALALAEELGDTVLLPSTTRPGPHRSPAPG